MKKTVSYWLIALWFLVMLISYWIFLPPINIFSVAFWIFVLEGLALAFVGLALLSLGGKVQQITFQVPGSRARKVVSAPKPAFGKALSAISFAIAVILLILGASTFLNSRLFRAKSYANYFSFGFIGSFIS